MLHTWHKSNKYTVLTSLPSRSSLFSTMPHGAIPIATTLFLVFVVLSLIASPTCLVTPIKHEIWQFCFVRNSNNIHFHRKIQRHNSSWYFWTFVIQLCHKTYIEMQDILGVHWGLETRDMSTSPVWLAMSIWPSHKFQNNKGIHSCLLVHKSDCSPNAWHCTCLLPFTLWHHKMVCDSVDV